MAANEFITGLIKYTRAINVLTDGEQRVQFTEKSNNEHI